MIFKSRKAFEEEVFKRVNEQQQREEQWRKNQEIEKRLCDLEWKVRCLESNGHTPTLAETKVCDG